MELSENRNGALLPLPVVCERLSISRAFLYELMNSGEIPSVKVGKRRLVPDGALTDYIERLMQESRQ